MSATPQRRIGRMIDGVLHIKAAPLYYVQHRSRQTDNKWCGYYSRVYETREAAEREIERARKSDEHFGYTLKTHGRIGYRVRTHAR